MQGIALGSSEDQIRSALDNIQAQWEKVIADAKDVKTANTDTIKSTYNELKDAVKNRPKDKPVTEVVAGLQTKLTAFAEAWKQFASSVDCKTAS